ncbi:hypothetical protein [Vibrio barjaei]|uniref:hypothetical protein n=1 Tax=Vibrio barjaei TaxID=1676683 RepID=UPI0022846ABD|nr:hypothetical protein [Vibrio barjaei]MCY9873912.1 hypothetical protein [Vibrio barjaei]
MTKFACHPLTWITHLDCKQNPRIEVCANSAAEWNRHSSEQPIPNDGVVIVLDCSPEGQFDDYWYMGLARTNKNNWNQAYQQARAFLRNKTIKGSTYVR